jgi:hypothetical protein
MPDAALAGDTCLFINHGPASAWWLSPDVVVNGFDGVPVPVGARTVTVTTRNQSGDQCNPTQYTGTKVELWVADPSLVMDKTNPTSCKRINKLPGSVPAGGGSFDVPFNWTVPAMGTGPESPGHKCLIGIVYPTGFTPDGVSFFPSDDPHYAQKNLCIVTCSSPCGIEVQTVNANRRRAETVILRATAVLKPDRTVLAAVMPALKRFKPFKRFSPKPPPPFRMMLEGSCDAKVTDRSASKSVTKANCGPSYEVKIVMKPRQRIRFHFSLNMAGVPYGDAFMFHLTHNVGRDILGGLTVVFVRAKC